ncbi:copper resistance protein CopC [Mesorhizobium sp. BAC0120]|uniref:copper resistance CopC/CopD family protein n=1 Tax=Mesorhizobium sp. BAC0120 TaxID=3090670 RepID=UPI00298D464D|nr:copper resistance protein CopC [Mesorhizobium sp. BAC0120]MDW6022309.1 copper resistance protein CopC [Mesorhizobium sp. BAC0120]
MAVISICISFLSINHAHAHAALISTVPAEGAVVAATPKEMSLTFNEPVSPLVLKLVRPDGAAAPLDRYVLKDTTVAFAAPALSEGTHVLVWRVVSADGHPVGGSVVFSVGAPSASGPPDINAPESLPVLVVIWFSKLGLYAGLFFGIGGVFFLSWVGPAAGGVRIFVRTALLLGLVAAFVSPGLQGLDALQLPLSAIVSRATWSAGMATSLADMAEIAAAAIVAALVALQIRAKAFAQPLSSLALAGVGLALAASGHASDAEPHWLTRPAVFLHAATIAFWVGALVPLAGLLPSGDPQSGAALRRFSYLIPWPLAALVVSGVVLAVIQVETPAALLTTSYGYVLSIKLGIVAALFALAAGNRWRLTKPAADGDAVANRRLTRAVRLELVLVALILGVVALWRFTPPPRAIAIEAAQPAAIHLHGEKAMADVTVTPGRAGAVVISAFIMSPSFDPLQAKEVTVSLSNPAAGIESIRRKAELLDGNWRVSDLTIPIAGRWKIAVDVLISDFETTKLEGEAAIKR